MYKHFGKRIFDIISSLLVICALSPVFFYLAWKIRKELGTPVLFTQIRPGRDGRLFRLYKFRSMTNTYNSDGNLLPDAERMTDFGRHLRDTSLDELPELWNILKGDMSVVGPRPQLVRDMVFFTADEMRRQSVTPGLTGLAQISGRNNLDWKERFRYDLQYIDRISFWEDMRIVYHTVFNVMKQKDISTDGMATSEDYGDWLLEQKLISHAYYKECQDKAKELMNNWR